MLEKFTRDARRAVAIAQELARELNSPKIDSRHLLAGLTTGGPATEALRAVGTEPADLARRIRTELTANDGLDAEALASLGINLESISARADELFGKGALGRAGSKPSRGHIRFTSEAKKTLEMALREVIRLQAGSIDSACLLLGLLRVDGPGRTLLTQFGTDLDALRTQLEHREAA